NLAAVIGKINEESDTTGVTASANAAGGIDLTSETTFTISSGGAAGAELGLDAATATEETVTGPVLAEPNTHTIDSLDILSADNAQLAIQALDDAIASVDSTRADLGAVQN